MLLSDRLRAAGVTAREFRGTPARHAALRDDPAALVLRSFRDRVALSAEEQARVLAATELPASLLGRRLDIVEGLYLFSDWGEAPGETTAILYRAALAAGPAGTVLDLGCGSGTLALLLATHAGHVTGTDINARALALARVNADANGIVNVDFREGSLFEPVHGQRFDLVVSQPPYVPQPAGAAHNLFLHGGERGDELAGSILAGLAGHLEPEGRALVFSDWPLRKGEGLSRLAVPGLRTTLRCSPPLTVEAYAAAYGEDLADHFRHQGIVAVRQCLAAYAPGEGLVKEVVLPHQW